MVQTRIRKLPRQVDTAKVDSKTRSRHDLIARGLSLEQRRNFRIVKEVLWESETATLAEVTRNEIELILALRSNGPAVRYNQWPKFKG